MKFKVPTNSKEMFNLVVKTYFTVRIKCQPQFCCYFRFCICFASVNVLENEKNNIKTWILTEISRVTGFERVGSPSFKGFIQCKINSACQHNQVAKKTIKGKMDFDGRIHQFCLTSRQKLELRLIKSWVLKYWMKSGLQ